MHIVIKYMLMFGMMLAYPFSIMAGLYFYVKSNLSGKDKKVKKNVL